MKMISLSCVCSINMGQSPDSSSYNDIQEGLPFFQGNADFGERYPTTRVWCNAPLKIAHANDILISVRAPIGAINMAKEECCIGRGLAAIAPQNEFISTNFLFWFLKSKYVELNNKGNGCTFKAINKVDLEELSFPYINFEEQKKLAHNLEKVNIIIRTRKEQLQKLDTLIKARFVEMFGDPVHNSKGLPTRPMTDVCVIIDGDRGKNYPKQNEFYKNEYCLFLNAKNVTKHGFDFSECTFITKEKDFSLKNGKLQRGDIVLTTRGTLGNLAFYTSNVTFENVRINSGMVILRMNRRIIDERFFIEQFRMQVDDVKTSIASGSAQPQLPISTMNKINVIMPTLSEQKKFASFIHQVDKSKVAVQNALDKAQQLFDSLMQKYFG